MYGDSLMRGRRRVSSTSMNARLPLTSIGSTTSQHAYCVLEYSDWFQVSVSCKSLPQPSLVSGKGGISRYSHSSIYTVFSFAALISRALKRAY